MATCSRLPLRNSNMRLLVALLCLCSGVVGAEIIPADRLIDWSTVGVSNGIPIRTNIYKYFGPSTNPTASQINSAITACPSNGVVMLLPGTGTISAPIYLKSYKTLRGSGMTNTVLRYTGGEKAIFISNQHDIDTPQPSNVLDITNGCTKNSTSIKVAQINSNFKAGALVFIDELTNGVFTYPHGRSGAFCTNCSRGNDGSRVLGQSDKIVSVVGNTINLETPLYWNYRPALQPQVWYNDTTINQAGIESLTIDNSASSDEYIIAFVNAIDCWATNVCTINANRGHYQLRAAYHCTIHGCYMTISRSGDAIHYGVEAQFYTSACLVENNIAYNMPAPIILGWCISGNVFAYNYLTNCWSSSGFMSQCISQHDSHPMFNLLEGNISPNIYFDDIWGSSSHQTAFRNRLYGWQPGGSASGGGIYTNPPTSGMLGFVAQAYQLTNNLIGNIIGCPSNAQNYLSYSTNQPCYTKANVYIGFADTGCETAKFDPRVYDSIIMHGNYTYAGATLRWDPSIADQGLPPSLYMTNPPSWFGDRPWPPIEPTNALAFSELNLPAAYRFKYKVNPPSGINPVTALRIGSVTP